MAGFIPDKTVHLTTGAASAATTATWSAGERLSIIASAACWIATGTAPTAVASTGVYVPAGIPMTILISGNLFKIAAIQASAAGDLTITQAIGD